MIASISGKLKKRKQLGVLLEVGGICYDIMMPPVVMKGIDKALTPDGSVTFITYHYYQMDQTKAIPVLVGNRMDNAAGMPPLRRRVNQFMSRLISRRIRQVVPDTQNGFRLYKCEVWAAVKPACSGFAAESEVLLDCGEMGVRIGAVPIRTLYGTERSKIHPVRDTWRFCVMLRRHDRKWRKLREAARA